MKKKKKKKKAIGRRRKRIEKKIVFKTLSINENFFGFS